MFDIEAELVYLAGHLNVFADYVSRANWSLQLPTCFRSSVLGARLAVMGRSLQEAADLSRIGQIAAVE